MVGEAGLLPAFAFGGFESREEVKEGDWGGCVFAGWVGKG